MTISVRSLAERLSRRLCEVSDYNAAAVSTFFHAHGDTLYDLEAQGSDRRPVERAVWSTLALPAGGRAG